jgi:predicted hotdog family 3-hydroxylacyl-ACP dehydratase
MLARSDIAKLIPQQGAMCLLDQIVSWNERTLTAATQSHRDVDNPLRDPSGLAALNLCEYAAQAMAIHGALTHARNEAKPGMLVSLRTVHLHRQYIHDLANDIVVQVDCLQTDATLSQYEFHALHDTELLASGRAIVILDVA